MHWEDVSDFLVKALEHLAAAVAVLLGGYLIARIARGLLRRWLRRHATRLGPSFVQLAAGSTFYTLCTLTVGLSLIALGVPVTFVTAIFLVLGVLLIALHESVADLAATVVFLIFRPFRRAN